MQTARREKKKNQETRMNSTRSHNHPRESFAFLHALGHGKKFTLTTSQNRRRDNETQPVYHRFSRDVRNFNEEGGRRVANVDDYKFLTSSKKLCMVGLSYSRIN
jgi:hypothetical protein